MEPKIKSLPGYRINEYLLVLNPHEELRNRMVEVKKEFNEKYQAESANMHPQVALVRFTQYAMMEERLINRLRTVAMGHTPFKVELKDFGSYPSHTIYINILSKPAVQGLVKELRREANRLMKLNEDHKPHYIMEPHVVVARGLKPWQYEKGWLEYSNKHFTGRFIADSMTLLARLEGEKKYYVVRKFQFENLPVATRQGELFRE